MSHAIFPARTLDSFVQLNMSDNRLGVEGAKAVAPALAKSSLTSIDLSSNYLTGGHPYKEMSGVKAIARAISSSAALRSTSLLCNSMDEKTVTMLLKVKESNLAIITLCGIKADQTEASFMGWGLKPADAKLLAPELANHGTLTKADLRGNRFSDDAKAQLRESAQGREKFVLRL